MSKTNSMTELTHINKINVMKKRATGSQRTKGED